MGQKPVAARLSTLPEYKLSRNALATSTAFQIALTAVLVSLPIFFPQKLATRMYEVTPIAAPQTEVLLPPKQPAIQPAVQRPELEETSQTPHVAKLIAPRNLFPPRAKPVEVYRKEVPELRQVLTEANFTAPLAQPARPRQPVKTGLLTTGSAALATVSQQVSRVQTGGFGNSYGLPGKSNPNKRANIAHFGSPALPPGPGYGNGTGGASGVRGTVASAGFGNSVAIPTSGGLGAARGKVKSGSFATATVELAAPKPKNVRAGEKLGQERRESGGPWRSKNRPPEICLRKRSQEECFVGYRRDVHSGAICTRSARG